MRAVGGSPQLSSAVAIPERWTRQSVRSSGDGDGPRRPQQRVQVGEEVGDVAFGHATPRPPRTLGSGLRRRASWSNSARSLGSSGCWPSRWGLSASMPWALRHASTSTISWWRAVTSGAASRPACAEPFQVRPQPRRAAGAGAVGWRVRSSCQAVMSTARATSRSARSSHRCRLGRLVRVGVRGHCSSGAGTRCRRRRRVRGDGGVDGDVAGEVVPAGGQVW